tara:strand:- start:2047 stop:3024 length:978 start_codon:yes stop_codon:yes gene_type:complete
LIGQAQAQDEATEDTTWTPIRHPSLYFFLPSNWDIETNPTEVDLIATSQLTDPSDTVRESFTLYVIESKAAPKDLPKLSEEILAELGEEFPDYKHLQSAPAQHGEHSGMAIEGTYNEAGEERYLRVFVLVDNDRVYVIREAGENQTLDGLRPIFDQILSSMHPFSADLGQTYYHSYFFIQYPEDWQVKEGLPGTHVAGLSQKEKWNDPFIERVSVGSEKMKPDVTFEEYADKHFEILLTRLPRANEISRGTPLVGDTRGRALEFSHRGGGHMTTLYIVMVPENDRIFTLIYSGMNPDYDEMKPTFYSILNSFASPKAPGTVSSHP